MANTAMLTVAVVAMATLQLIRASSIAKRAPGEDPDLRLDARGLITSKGYTLQEHSVKTKDGYILSIHRIPYGRIAPGNVQSQDKPVVFLQHGLMGSSENWIMNMAHQSLAFILADAGYDVWMPNSRGTLYSRRHERLSPNSAEFWQFSFHEMAMIDLPATADYVASRTGGRQMYYVSHSQGGMIGFIKFSQDPQWAASRFRQFHGLAPASYLRSVTSLPLRLLAPMTSTLDKFLQLIGANEFAASPEIMKLFSDQVCARDITSPVCGSFLMMLTVYSPKYMNQTRMPVFVAHSNGGTSSMNIVHYGQMVSSGNFQPYDYGLMGNMRRYSGRATPPPYNITTMSIPTVIYTGDADSIVSPADVALLKRDLGRNLVKHYTFPDAVHLDFVWGLNGPTQVYPLLLAELAADLRRPGAPGLLPAGNPNGPLPPSVIPLNSPHQPPQPPAPPAGPARPGMPSLTNTQVAGPITSATNLVRPLVQQPIARASHFVRMIGSALGGGSSNN